MGRGLTITKQRFKITIMETKENIKFIKVSEDTHKGFKILAAELGMTFDETLAHVLDYFRDDSIRSQEIKSDKD